MRWPKTPAATNSTRSCAWCRRLGPRSTERRSTACRPTSIRWKAGSSAPEEAAMLMRVLADAVVVFHLLFVAFAVAGGLLAFRWRCVPLLHLPALGWAAWVEFTGRICPMTPLENALRAAGGEAGYSGG